MMLFRCFSQLLNYTVCGLLMSILICQGALASNYNNSKFNKTRALALEDDTQAQYELAHMYRMGYGTDIDLRLALFWYNKAIEKGHPEAEYELGMLYYEGTDIPQELEHAFALISQAAAQKHIKAISQLGYLYEKGMGTEPDLNKAIELYEIAIASDDMNAMYHLSVMILDKRHPSTTDTKRALDLLRRAAIEGHAESQGLMGDLYYYGQHGLPQYYPLAVAWYANAAILGHESCLYKLGMMYYKGEGVKQDTHKALRLLSNSANRGHLASLFMIGKIQNEMKLSRESSKTFEKACSLGYEEACEELKNIF